MTVLIPVLMFIRFCNVFVKLLVPLIYYMGYQNTILE